MTVVSHLNDTHRFLINCNKTPLRPLSRLLTSVEGVMVGKNGHDRSRGVVRVDRLILNPRRRRHAGLSKERLKNYRADAQSLYVTGAAVRLRRN